MADEHDMEFLMLLANIIVCLQLNVALYNAMMASHRRQIAVFNHTFYLGLLRVQFEQEIGLADQLEDFGFDLVDQACGGKIL